MTSTFEFGYRVLKSGPLTARLVILELIAWETKTRRIIGRAEYMA